MMLAVSICILAASSACAALPAASTDLLPLIIWHGLGDSYDADGIKSVGELAQEINPGTFVYNVRLADNGSGDRRATFFGNVTKQLETVCDDLATHPILSQVDAVNALGFSQGGQFLRAYAERCNAPKIHNLVTFGAQHNGINKFQGCGSNDWLCKGAEALLSSNTWSRFAQSSLVPAQYFRDPSDLDPYLEDSNFLADINNERKHKSKGYKDGIIGMNKFVMYVFEDDVAVHPKESGWFSEKNSTSGKITDLRDRQLYKEDWLGLKELDENDGLVFKTTPGGHMQLSDKVLRETFRTYFAPTESSGHSIMQGVRNAMQDSMHHLEDYSNEL